MAQSLVTKHVIELMTSLNKSSEKDLKARLHTIFADAGNIDFNTSASRESMLNLIKAFQTIFSQAGVTGINFEEMIKMPDANAFTELGKLAATQFWDAWNSVAQNGTGSGSVVGGAKQQLDELSLRCILV